MPNSTPDRTQVRTLTGDDLDDALALYGQLRTSATIDASQAAKLFAAILSHPGTTVWGAEQGGRVVSMATAHLLPNLTYGGRPCCLVENVVTLESHRGQGFGRATLTALAEFVWASGGYKIMLLTGWGRGAEGFYTSIGFDADEKHGMVMRRP